jgi:hypothetical protein
MPATFSRSHPPRLEIDPWRLSGSMTTEVVPTGEKQEVAFFEFPTDAVLPAPISMAANQPNFRLKRPFLLGHITRSPLLDLLGA